MSFALQLEENLKNYPLPDNSSLTDIKNGKPLSPLIKSYHTRIKQVLLNTDGINEIFDHIKTGITSLQTAINNKKEYRAAKSHVPSWVYQIFDYLGWGAVGRAERELYEIINTIVWRSLLTWGIKESDPSVKSMGSYITSFDLVKLLKPVNDDLLCKVISRIPKSYHNDLIYLLKDRKLQVF